MVTAMMCVCLRVQRAGFEAEQIAKRLALQNSSVADEDLIGSISSIVYRNDRFEYGGMVMEGRHIDVELSFGEYYEITQENPLFEFICTLCEVPLSEREWMIHKKENPLC